ncbi:apoptosis inhibitor 5 [Cylas formicarius]|uniref:apoptosis inhibitor 5 n=1 Tax=Cylas formicarius TaxID=197179 RepID=UPI0029584184|nr:apoptosis inhibitor 5 [Cylas formicarius]
MADLLEALYEKYEVLSAAKDKIDQHSKEYEDCIEGTKGDAKEKKLAAQIICKFFKNFPSLQDQALNAILDLCEDSDSDIRICAMKTLPLLCKSNKEFVSNIGSILSQLLQLEDQDYTTACNSLIQVFKEDQVNATKGILSNILSPADETIREKCISFLYTKLAKLQVKLGTELEDLLIEEGKKILQDSTSNEFLIVMPFLMDSKLIKTTAGQQEMVDLVAERVELSETFDPLEEGSNNTDRLIMCVDCILSVFNANVNSTKFVVYYCDQVLPRWDTIGTLENGETLQLRLLRQLAELSAHCGDLESTSVQVGHIFEKIKDYMPLPPENVDMSEVPNLDFSSVECLLYAFHKLARKCPEFLTADPQLLKDFRQRLQYFSRGVQGCKRGLENTLANKKDGLSREEQAKLKVAPIVLNNINSLIKDLFYQPPLYKCNVQLSFKKEDKKIKVSETHISPSGGKRHVPITFDSSNGSTAKQNRSNRSGEDRKLYTPPSGKFSNNFARSSSRGGRGRGGPVPRGRGSRTWRN